MGGAVYTEDLVAKQERKEKIYEMMRQGDWRAVCKEFHVGQNKFLETKSAKKTESECRRRTSTGNRCLFGFGPPRFAISLFLYSRRHFHNCNQHRH